MIRIKTWNGKDEIVTSSVGELITELLKHSKDMAVLFTWEGIVCAVNSCERCQMYKSGQIKQVIEEELDNNPFSFISEEEFGDENPPQNVVMIDCE